MEKPTFSEMREITESSDSKISATSNNERRNKWIVYDSPLLSSQAADNDITRFSDFDSAFYDVLPPEYSKNDMNIQDYIETELGDKKGQAIGVEFGGPGRKLFSGFTPGFFSDTAGIILNDLVPPSDSNSDSNKHHQVIEGNMFSRSTLKKIENWLNGRQIDVIFERIEGGRENTPDIIYIDRLFKWWYEHLSEGGVIFAQLPYDYATFGAKQDNLNKWVNMINDQYQQVLNVDLDRNYFDQYKIRLNKYKGAPKDLPTI